MTRKEHAIKELEKKGFELIKPKLLKGGINNAVYRVEDKQGTYYALKLYTIPSKEDSRNRQLTERKFLQYMETCDVCNTPLYINGNIMAGWSLLGWIEGEKLTKVGGKEIKEIADFIQKINAKEQKTKEMN